LNPERVPPRKRTWTRYALGENYDMPVFVERVSVLFSRVVLAKGKIHSGMRGKLLYTFAGCKFNVEGQQVILIYTPFSHKPDSERAIIEGLLARLRQKQPVILVYVKFDETTLKVIDPPEWKESIDASLTVN
jgi:hypothetical protein